MGGSRRVSRHRRPFRASVATAAASRDSIRAWGGRSRHALPAADDSALEPRLALFRRRIRRNARAVVPLAAPALDLARRSLAASAGAGRRRSIGLGQAGRDRGGRAHGVLRRRDGARRRILRRKLQWAPFDFARLLRPQPAPRQSRGRQERRRAAGAWLRRSIYVLRDVRSAHAPVGVDAVAVPRRRGCPALSLRSNRFPAARARRLAWILAAVSGGHDVAGRMRHRSVRDAARADRAGRGPDRRARRTSRF